MSAEELSIEDFGFLQRLLYERSGFMLDADKHYVAEVRLLGLVSRLGYPSISAMMRELREDHRLEQQTIEALLNAETLFFRDIRCFRSLEQSILPDLITRRASARTLRIWSAAASTGQEIFSVAMLLADVFPHLSDWDLHLWATDWSEANLERARRGRYSQFEVNRGLPVRHLVKYFEPEGADWVLSDELRSKVQFARVNLVEPLPSGPLFDVILLRNVMIYWVDAVKRRVLSRLKELLAPDGYLVLGGAETSGFPDEGFERVSDESGCYLRLR